MNGDGALDLGGGEGGGGGGGGGGGRPDSSGEFTGHLRDLSGKESLGLCGYQLNIVCRGGEGMLRGQKVELPIQPHLWCPESV